MREPSKPSRRLIKLCQSPSIPQRALAPTSAVQRCSSCYSSASDASVPGAAGIDFETIRAEMLGRGPRIHLDTMQPTNSDRLTRALADFLPKECYAKQQIPERKGVHRLPHDRPLVPAGHHLMYFTLRPPDSRLCPDGGEAYYSPHGTPFTRRMWAGGSIRDFRGMVLEPRTAVCHEQILDVKLQGSAGGEKISVEVLREYMTGQDFERRFDEETQKIRSHDDPANPRTGLPLGDTDWDPRQLDLKGITEHRTLVFMREPSLKEKMANLEKKEKTVKPPKKPEYSVTLTPTPTLLFHYSALSYNEHRIHLDRSYCREVEGYRDLLVHGPLSLTLMLSVLQSRLAEDETQYEFIHSVDYRHLAPLYVNQPMRVCVAWQKTRASESPEKESPGKESAGRKKAEIKSAEEESGSNVRAQFAGQEPVEEIGRNKWHIWIENHNGGLCVKGTAETVKRRILPQITHNFWKDDEHIGNEDGPRHHVECSDIDHRIPLSNVRIDKDDRI
ncbi:hypothetical protein F4824DRAFT_442463 [Ustulina deusta]|nr:hypothetical protein F4824DRAFT_442463 [Ustulina deusta]